MVQLQWSLVDIGMAAVDVVICTLPASLHRAAKPYYAEATQPLLLQLLPAAAGMRPAAS